MSKKAGKKREENNILIELYFQWKWSLDLNLNITVSTVNFHILMSVCEQLDRLQNN